MKSGDWKKAIRKAWPEGCLCIELGELFRLIRPDADDIDKSGSVWRSFRNALPTSDFVVDDLP